VHWTQYTRLTRSCPSHFAPFPLFPSSALLPHLLADSGSPHATEALGIVTHDISLYDHKLCHPFVAGICPHDLFTNTVRPSSLSSLSLARCAPR